MGSSSSRNDGKNFSKSTAREVLEYYASAANIPIKEFLKDKVAIVTGGNRGIGLETCKCLASGGCRVIMGVRNVDAGQRALKDEIVGEKIKVTGNYSVPNAVDLVKVLPLDLENLASIRSFVEALGQVTSQDSFPLYIHNMQKKFSSQDRRDLIPLRTTTKVGEILREPVGDEG